MSAAAIRRAIVALVLAAGVSTGASVASAQTAPGPQIQWVPTVAVSADLQSTATETRLDVVLSRPVEARAFLLERPDRVIVDLPEVNFQLPAEASRRKGGVVASFRFGLFAPGRSRIVIDLAQPALVAKAETITRPDGAAMLSIVLRRVERDVFVRNVSVPEPAPRRAAAEAPAGDRRPVVVLDAGHGGVDPGALAGSVPEKDIVFAFADRLRKRLEAAGRYRVVMTRDHDVFISLADRVKIARAANADLFVSIHADSISGQPQVRGLTVYTGSERASDAESARLADRENQADAAGGVEGGENADDVADILLDLTTRETRTYSHRFARTLVGSMESVARLNGNAHRQAGFRVLRAHDVPSVLVELGYLSSKKDIDLLLSDEWRDKTTATMAGAIDRYFSTRLATGADAPVSP
jgi:N-acetylmuramoyl-L-alanine amidase